MSEDSCIWSTGLPLLFYDFNISAIAEYVNIKIGNRGQYLLQLNEQSFEAAAECKLTDEVRTGQSRSSDCSAAGQIGDSRPEIEEAFPEVMLIAVISPSTGGHSLYLHAYRDSARHLSPAFE